MLHLAGAGEEENTRIQKYKNKEKFKNTMMLHLAGAGEEESFLNRRSPLLLQSGEVVQAVAVSHLEIWIDLEYFDTCRHL